jgi:hypothetical protein
VSSKNAEKLGAVLAAGVLGLIVCVVARPAVDGAAAALRAAPRAHLAAAGEREAAFRNPDSCARSTPSAACANAAGVASPMTPPLQLLLPPDASLQPAERARLWRHSI